MKVAKDTAELGTVGGLAVVRDEALLSGLRRPMKYRQLTLQDGSTVIGCGECPKPTDFTGSRGEVQRHRMAEHGMKGGSIKPRRPSDPPVLNDAVDPEGEEDSIEDDGELVAAEADALEIPAAVGAMTIAEVFRLGGELQRLGDLVEELRAENRDVNRRYKEEKAARSEAEGKLAVLSQTFVQLNLPMAAKVDA